MSKLALVTALCLISVSSQAQTPPPPLPQDKVSFTLSVEDWVETSTARVEVAVDAAGSGDDSARTRDAVKKAVDSLAPGAKWRFSTFEPSQDSSGLEHWHAELETRLKETDLGGLADKAKAASKAGLQLTISNIDNTPSLAETEAVRQALRARIYAEVNDELAQLQAAEPHHNFRVGQIVFQPGEGVFRPMVMRGMAMASGAVPASAPGEAPTVQQKVTLTANVELLDEAPKP